MELTTVTGRAIYWMTYYGLLTLFTVAFLAGAFYVIRAAVRGIRKMLR